VYFSVIGGGSGRPLSPSAPANGRKHPRLATSGSGETLLVWTEGTAWARGGSLAWQVFDAKGQPLARAVGAVPGVPAWSFGAAAATRSGFVVIY
jgi:hypothetical protein